MSALRGNSGRLSTGLRVFLSTFAAALLIALAVFGYFLLKNRETLEATLFARGEIATHLLAENLRLPAFTEDREAAERSIDALRSQGDVAGIAVFTGDKKLLLEWTAPRWEFSAARGATGAAAIPSALERSGKILILKEEGAIHFWSRIVARPAAADIDSPFQLQKAGGGEGAKPIGYVRLTLADEGMWSEQGDLIVKSVVVGVFLLIACALVTLLVLRTAAAPLARLAGKVGRSRPLSGKRRIWSTLTDPYSELVEELNESVTAINDLNLHLEKMVGQRTEELSSANEQLKCEVAVRQRLIEELKQAATEIKRLEGILPTCANCRKVRDENGKWVPIETYVSQRSEARFSHGLCEDCVDELYPDYKKRS